MCNLEGGELILECAESFPNSVRWGLEWIRSAGFVFLAWAGGHCCEWHEIRGVRSGADGISILESRWVGYVVRGLLTAEDESLVMFQLDLEGSLTRYRSEARRLLRVRETMTFTLHHFPKSKVS
jgi:hypothetical protein